MGMRQSPASRARTKNQYRYPRLAEPRLGLSSDRCSAAPLIFWASQTESVSLQLPIPSFSKSCLETEPEIRDRVTLFSLLCFFRDGNFVHSLTRNLLTDNYTRQVSRAVVGQRNRVVRLDYIVQLHAGYAAAKRVRVLNLNSISR